MAKWSLAMRSPKSVSDGQLRPLIAVSTTTSAICARSWASPMVIWNESAVFAEPATFIRAKRRRNEGLPDALCQDLRLVLAHTDGWCSTGFGHHRLYRKPTSGTSLDASDSGHVSA